MGMKPLQARSVPPRPSGRLGASVSLNCVFTGLQYWGRRQVGDVRKVRVWNPEDTRRPLQPGKSRRRGWVSRNCCHPRGTGADGDSAWGQPWSLLFPKQRLAGVPCPLQREAVSQCVQSGEDLGVPPSCSASLWLQCDPGETQKLLKDSRNAQIVVYWVLGAGVSL